MPSIFDMFQAQFGDKEVEQIAKRIGADPSKTREAISMTLPTMIEALARQTEKQGGAEKIHSQLNSSAHGSSGKAQGESVGSMLEQLDRAIQQETSGRPSNVAQNHVSPAKTSPQPRPPQFPDEILPPGLSAPMQRPNATPQSQQRPQAQQPPAPTQSRSADSGPMDIFGDLFGGKQGRVADAVSKSSGIGNSQAGSLIEILGPLLSGTLAQQTQSGKMSSQDLDKVLKQDRARVQQSPGGGMLGKLLDQDGDGDFDMNDMMKLGMSFLFKK